MVDREDREQRESGTRQCRQRLVQTREEVERAGIEVAIVSTSATGDYYISTSYDGVTEVQAGSYALMDAAYAKLDLGFRNALSVRTMVTSLLLAAAVALAVAALMGPVEAQTMTVETIPPELDDNGRTAGERVDEIVLIIRILAGVLLAGTAAFWWHTRPARATLRDNASAPLPDEVVTSGEA